MKQLSTIIFVILTFNLLTQNTSKLDKIIKKNYDVLDVNINKVSETEVEFTYPNETLKNSISLSKIAKIIFKSGRIQEFKIEEKIAIEKPNSSEENNLELQKKSELSIAKKPIRQNTIAVLPIPFVNSETLASSSEMAKFAQNDVYSKLIQKLDNIFPLTVQDLRETNSLLQKAGINSSKIDEVTIEDLQNALGVDHIVAAKVSYVLTVDKTSTNYGNTTIEKRNDKNAEIDDFNISTTEEDKKFDYMIYFDIYKNGTKIFTESREPFFRNKDSWIDAMQYLLKRSPIYTRK